MMIEQITSADLLRTSREAFYLSPEGGVDDTFLAAALRRAAANLSPCPRRTLAVTLRDSLRFLADDDETMATRIEDATEGLIVAGDLLELSHASSDDTNAKATWVFSAPPAFVCRQSGTIVLMGIAPDDMPTLPAALAQRIVHCGCLRVIYPDPSEDLPATLSGLGLARQSEKAWLRSPREQTAEELVAGLTARLMSQPPSGPIEDLEILDTSRNEEFYPRRWAQPEGKSGNFVARRPQAYGAPLWCYVNLENGAPKKMLEFPLREATRWRGCDVAWHLQMAIDNCRGKPQEYRLCRSSEGPRLDFFSPLPLWAHRRLSIAGQAVSARGRLSSYRLPEQELAAEEDFLRERLWLKASNK